LADPRLLPSDAARRFGRYLGARGALAALVLVALGLGGCSSAVIRHDAGGGSGGMEDVGTGGTGDDAGTTGSGGASGTGGTDGGVDRPPDGGGPDLAVESRPDTGGDAPVDHIGTGGAPGTGGAGTGGHGTGGAPGTGGAGTGGVGTGGAPGAGGAGTGGAADGGTDDAAGDGSQGDAAPVGKLIITEVAPWGSSITAYGADWFEVTNVGSAAVDMTGWTMDDISNEAALSAPIFGVGSIAPGQSVVLIEGNITNANSFITAWFGTNPPAGFVIGTYSGSGVGLSTGGDAVNLFNASGAHVTGVQFGASTNGVTFDNTAGNATVSTLSVVGVNGAFMAADGFEVGSPGR
jgi:hypothetical protein